MRITNIRTRQVDIDLPVPFFPAWAPGTKETRIRVAYVRIDTDAGIHGVAGHEFYGAEEQAVQRIATYLVGEDPLRIEKHAGTLRYLWPYFGTAVWFVELALWDILGKVAGLPVYRLLGNYRDEVPAYASTGQNRTPTQRADDCRRLQDEGYRAVKLRIHNETVAEDLAQVKAVRKAVGDGMAIMVDANQTDLHDAPMPGPHWTYHRALETAQALADYRVEWLEEPLPRHDYADLRRLRAASPIPIAGGEVNQQLHDLHRLLVDGCYDILQPDVTLSEGLLRTPGAGHHRPWYVGAGEPPRVVRRAGDGRQSPSGGRDSQYLVLRIPARPAGVPDQRVPVHAEEPPGGQGRSGPGAPRPGTGCRAAGLDLRLKGRPRPTWSAHTDAQGGAPHDRLAYPVHRNARVSEVMNWTPGTRHRLSRSSFVMKRSTWAVPAQASWTASGARTARSWRICA